MAERIEWRRDRRGNWESWTEIESGNSYSIIVRKDGRWFARGHRPGGAEVRLPFRDFETAEDAMAWVAEREAQAAESLKAARAETEEVLSWF